MYICYTCPEMTIVCSFLSKIVIYLSCLSWTSHQLLMQCPYVQVQTCQTAKEISPVQILKFPGGSKCLNN